MHTHMRKHIYIYTTQAHTDIYSEARKHTAPTHTHTKPTDTYSIQEKQLFPLLKIPVILIGYTRQKHLDVQAGSRTDSHSVRELVNN